MSLPIYHHIHLKTEDALEIASRLTPEMNLKSPVVFHLENYDLDKQREIIGVIENYFDVNNVSFRFPYPVYFISGLETSVSKMSVFASADRLPKFFTQKEGRMNVKETHLALKNRLLHQEIRNVDPAALQSDLETYAQTHRLIYETEREASYYKQLLQKLQTSKKRG